MTKRVMVFPGQGSQVVGMGKELADSFKEAKDVFAQVDETLKQHLSKLMFEGPIETLTETQNAQPALMAVSVAVMRVIEKQGKLKLADIASYVAGHSLGEYSALCAAGAIDVSQTALLLRTRGNAMQDAVPKGKGGMVALVGTDYETAQLIAKKASVKGVCQAANDNGGGQVVISGAMEAIDYVIELAAEHGIRRAVKLPVSAPFHSQLMEPAAAVMQEALARATIHAPVIPVIANVTADEVTDAETIRRLLVEQVTGMVRWRESVIALKHKGVTHAVECGSGKVLAGLIKRIEPDMQALSIGTPQEVEAFLASL